MSKLALLVVGTVGSAVAHAQSRVDPHDAFAAAVEANDAKAAAALVDRFPFPSKNLWFDTAECTKKFSGKRTIAKAQWAAYVACLQTLGMRSLSHVGSRAFTYQPGLRIEAPLHGSKIKELTYPFEHGADPTVSDPVLRNGLVGTIFPTAEDLAASRRPEKDGVAKLTYCVSRTGKVEDVHVDRAEPSSWGETVRVVLGQTHFQPFLRAKKPVRVCGQVEYTFTAVMTSSSPPDLQRISGATSVDPDEAVIDAMRADGMDVVSAVFQLCVSRQGTVSSVSAQRSSGYPAYDEKIMRAIERWQYKPWSRSGMASGLCTAAPFVYKRP